MDTLIVIAMVLSTIIILVGFWTLMCQYLAKLVSNLIVAGIDPDMARRAVHNVHPYHGCDEDNAGIDP